MKLTELNKKTDIFIIGWVDDNKDKYELVKVGRSPQTDEAKDSALPPGYVQLCPYCKKDIPAQMVQQGGCHMHCHNTEIDVWFISLPDAPDHGFYEVDPTQVMEQLKSAEHDDPYLIQRKIMLAGRYYNLKEFDGF